MKKPKWERNLNKKDMQHIRDTSHDGELRLSSFLGNIVTQTPGGSSCLECWFIAKKLKLEGLVGSKAS